MQERKSVEGILASITLLFVLLIILSQVLARIIPSISMVWSEELSRWVWVWVVCLCWGELERSNQHLKMSFLEDKMSASIRFFVTLILDVIYLIVLINLFFIGKSQVMNTIDSMAVTLPVSRFVLYIALPIGLLSVIVRVLLRIFNRIKKYTLANRHDNKRTK